MIRQSFLYKSNRIEVRATPAVERLDPRRLKWFVKAAIAAEKTIISSICKKYRKETEDIKFSFVFKNFKTDDVLGNCDVEYDGSILIELNSKAMGANLCKTIAHELVHARQFISGQLTYNTRIQYLTYEGDKHRYIYRRQPWEIEAYKLESKGELRMKKWLLNNTEYQPKIIR
jgi:hypothetical protein